MFSGLRFGVLLILFWLFVICVCLSLVWLVVECCLVCCLLVVLDVVCRYTGLDCCFG